MSMGQLWDNYAGLFYLGLMAFLFIGVAGGAFAALYIGQSNTANAITNAKHDLELQGYTVVQGDINSPTVIELTKDYKTFTQATVGMKIYEANGRFNAIFNATYGLAYQPSGEQPIWWIWGTR